MAQGGIVIGIAKVRADGNYLYFSGLRNGNYV